MSEITDHWERIWTFMGLGKQETPGKPVTPSVEVRRLRANLILEEALETIRALGFGTNKVGLVDLYEPDLVEIVDGCLDVSVVTIGTLVACGVKDKRLLEIVDKNNLDKFGPGHTIREDGKVIKPPNHKPPTLDIERELIRQGWDGHA